MVNRDFKGVWIPKQVWLDKNLTMIDKGILTEIDSLDIGDDGCWAGNEYLAEFCQCSISKVTAAISKLTKLGYIKVESFDGRRRKIRSCLLKSRRQTNEKNDADCQKVRVSNTSNRTTNNTNNISHTRKREESDLRFDRFWAEYPRKVAKQDAAKAWRSLKADDAMTDIIIADVRKRKETEWKGQAVQYIPHPATYIRQRRWEDETQPQQRTEKGEGWHNPALDYAQRDYTGTQPKHKVRILNIETGEWEDAP